MMRQLTITIVLLAGLLLADRPRVDAVAVDWPVINLVPVATGLPSVTHIGNAGDGSGRLFIVQQTGTIRIIKNGTVLATRTAPALWFSHPHFAIRIPQSSAVRPHPSASIGGCNSAIRNSQLTNRIRHEGRDATV